MNPISEQIRSNQLKVYIGIGVLTAIVGILGSLISYLFNWGLTGTGYFLLVAAVIDFIAYFYSDKIVLRIARAKALPKEAAPELYDMTDRLCHKAGIPLPKLYLIEDPAINAFATGRNHSHSAVAVTRGLLERLTPEEVEAVVAHELSHIKNYDMRTMAVVGVLGSAVSIIADMYWYSNISAKVQEKDRSGILAIVGVIIAILAPISAMFIQLAISRKREFIADAGSAQLTSRGRSLASALKKISMDMRLPARVSTATAHLYFSNPSNESGIDKWFSTHPPIGERISALEKMNY